MPSVATQHEKHIGHTVDTGHCVPFVRAVTGLPPTGYWRRGCLVQEGLLAPGTAVATFNAAGKYPNSMGGNSHAAILMVTHNDGSITVLDQWLGQPVHQRVIRNRHGKGDAVNDASRFYVIETMDDGDG